MAEKELSGREKERSLLAEEHRMRRVDHSFLSTERSLAVSRCQFQTNLKELRLPRARSAAGWSLPRAPSIRPTLAWASL